MERQGKSVVAGGTGKIVALSRMARRQPEGCITFCSNHSKREEGSTEPDADDDILKCRFRKQTEC